MYNLNCVVAGKKTLSKIYSMSLYAPVLNCHLLYSWEANSVAVEPSLQLFKVPTDALGNKLISFTDGGNQTSTTKTAFVSVPICRDWLTNLF